MRRQDVRRLIKVCRLRTLQSCTVAFAGLALAILLVGNGAAQSANGKGRRIANNTPRFVQQAENVGPEDSSKVIEVTFWLQQNKQNTLHPLVQQLYQKDSPRYHHWLTPAELNASFAPKEEDTQVMAEFLAAHNLSVVSVSRNNLYVKAQGTVSDVQNALHVQINKFKIGGKTYRANTSDPVIEGPAGALVAAVGGMDDLEFQPHFVRPVDPDTNLPFPAVPLGPAPFGVFFEGQCFRPPEIDTFTTHGGLPIATYQGNRYGADITNNQLGHLPPCGYSPSELHKAYKLDPVYNAGYDGTGQAVVIVDAFGSPTIQEDSELFSQVYGLPDINLTVICPSGQCTLTNTGWATETTLDVEWAHAIAPNAAIILVVAKTNSFDDLNAAVSHAVTNHLGNVISNSYGNLESIIPQALLDYTNQLIETAAAVGISVNFSTGDDGDFTTVAPPPFAPTVSFPASSPWATSIGGTSLSLKKNSTIDFQTGWGNNITRIVNTIAQGSTPVVPPLNQGFDFGGGGGVSGYFAKPPFQNSLPGAFRHEPDIAYLADPYTGVEVICDGVSCGTGPAGPAVSVIGGTSLACPMFSGLWAVAAQKAGEALGQAAQLVYGLPPSAIDDIVPVGSKNNVSGVIHTSTGNIVLSPAQLVPPLENTITFYSALYNSPFSTRWFVLSFGTDTSLTTGPGWDNVTGVGTPTGMPFLNAVAHAAGH